MCGLLPAPSSTILLSARIDVVLQDTHSGRHPGAQGLSLASSDLDHKLLVSDDG